MSDMWYDGSTLVINGSLYSFIISLIILPALNSSWLIFTTNGNSNDVTVIDVASNRAVQSIPAGQQPWGVVAGPD